MATPISPSILHQIFDAPDLPEPVRLGWVEIMGAALCAMVIGVSIAAQVPAI